jgi:ceramide glucosyltransferase
MSIIGSFLNIKAAFLTRKFMRGAYQESVRAKIQPSVSLLKPMAGVELGLELGLNSLMNQEYSNYEIIYGVAHPEDPALVLAQKLVNDFPHIRQIISIDTKKNGENPKISNLMNMISKSHSDLIIFADSDIIAFDKDYLSDIVQSFDDHQVGIVTCLYRAQSSSNLSSRLGAMGINYGFLPSALLARYLGRKDGCFGATIALSKKTLEDIGGLDQCKNVLADDWVLGNLVRRHGKIIGLASKPVDLMVTENCFRDLFFHELRWARTIASIDRLSYTASIIMQPIPLALLALLGGKIYFLFLVILAIIARWGSLSIEREALKIKPSSFIDFILRESLSITIYFCAILGRTVEWRGKKYRVRNDGIMELLKGKKQ